MRVAGWPAGRGAALRDRHPRERAATMIHKPHRCACWARERTLARPLLTALTVLIALDLFIVVPRATSARLPSSRSVFPFSLCWSPGC